MLKSFLALTFFVSCYAYSQSDAGETFKFSIPSRPVGSIKANETARSIRLNYGSAEEYRTSAFRRCPRISKLIFKVADKIIQTNNLQKFALSEAPGFKIDVGCLYVLPKGTGKGGPSSNSNGLSIPAFIAATSSAEDEVAFIIAHEMAHIILGHNELMADSVDFSIPDETRYNLLQSWPEWERAADNLATILLANSGYDPRAVTDALCGVTRFSNDVPPMIPCIALSFSDDGLHGSNRSRANRVFTKLVEINYSKSPERIRSEDLAEAAKEVEEIRISIKSPKN